MPNTHIRHHPHPSETDPVVAPGNDFCAPLLHMVSCEVRQSQIAAEYLRYAHSGGHFVAEDQGPVVRMALPRNPETAAHTLYSYFLRIDAKNEVAIVVFSDLSILLGRPDGTDQVVLLPVVFQLTRSIMPTGAIDTYDVLAKGSRLSPGQRTHLSLSVKGQHGKPRPLDLERLFCARLEEEARHFLSAGFDIAVDRSFRAENAHWRLGSLWLPAWCDYLPLSSHASNQIAKHLVTVAQIYADDIQSSGGDITALIATLSTPMTVALHDTDGQSILGENEDLTAGARALLSCLFEGDDCLQDYISLLDRFTPGTYVKMTGAVPPPAQVSAHERLRFEGLLSEASSSLPRGLLLPSGRQVCAGTREALA